jgi:PPOX class probable F420-dependent enzyme
VSGLEDFARLVQADHGLSVVSTLRPDGTIQSSVVNAGVLSHPVTGTPVVGLVSRGGTRKLANLRERPRATVVVRAGWDWAAAEGPVELAGPDDPMAGVDTERLRLLLREIFTAAGGTHDDWATYDQVMAAERRTAVLLAPARISANRLPAGSASRRPLSRMRKSLSRSRTTPAVRLVAALAVQSAPDAR